MAEKILVVDDEPQFERLIKQRFRREIRNEVYEFLFANNGREALRLLRESPGVEIVLSDINMPDMDGITLLSNLQKEYPDLRTVMVSAYGDMQNIRKAMNLGAFDFVVKPIDFADLTATIQKTSEQVAIVKQAQAAKVLQEENAQLQSLDELKNRFFNNITHELRTPLTVILGIAQQLEVKPEEWLDQGVSIIKRNCHNLLLLINQMLDLGKLESAKLELQPIQSDVAGFLAYLSESFEVLAEKNDLQFHFLCSRSELAMDYDPGKLLSVIYNLLSNAIKFTPAGGHIYLQIDQIENDLVIRVRDTGRGMSAEDLPLVFDRFFQAGSDEADHPGGSGIGLALTKELTELMGGQIEVESQLGKGTTFIVKLPISRNAPLIHINAKEQLENQLESYRMAYERLEEEPELDDGSDELPKLLLVEDHPDVSQYLVALLKGKYQLLVANDGDEGITKALEFVPDVIVSDVMMPKKDGFELCQTLKTDERTSHIPIILLTARADAASRISGLQRGADAYLAKPFNEQELLVRIRQLLELRRQLQKRYQSIEIPDTTDDPGIQQEDEFIIKIRELVEENIDDEQFGIHEICRAIGLSRTQLHHKIKALTGRPTSHYIRAIRLHRAKQLLQTTSLNISEIAYEVGFRDPKYFSRTYREEFGKNPREVRD